MSLETINFSRLKLKPDDLVLDLGCGEGRHAITAYLTANAHVIGLDLDATDLGTGQVALHDFEDAGNTEKQLEFRSRQRPEIAVCGRNLRQGHLRRGAGAYR